MIRFNLAKLRLFIFYIIVIIYCVNIFVQDIYALKQGSFKYKFDKSKLNEIRDNEIYIKADKVYYDGADDILEASGFVNISTENFSIEAEKIIYNVKNNELKAIGNLTVRDIDGNIIHARDALFKDKLKFAIINQMVLLIDDSKLFARVAKRLNENELFLEDASFTPCKIYCNKEPIWKITSYKSHVNFEKQEIEYRRILFKVYGVPVLYMPYFKHPTPNAPAKSGILVPSMKQKALVVPFYLRVSNSFDITLAPRIAKNYVILESEIRGASAHGKYNINGSYTELPKKVEKGKTLVQSNPKIARHHIDAKGAYEVNNLNYGFNIKRSSDDSYLKNYHNILDTFLESNVYLYNVNKQDYFAIKGLHYQDLGSNNKEAIEPLVLPKVFIKKKFALNDENDLNLTIKNNSVYYTERNTKQIARTATEILLNKNLTHDSGNIFDFSISDRFDYYNYNYNCQQRSKNLSRNIPEIGLNWQMILINKYIASERATSSIFKLTPKAMLIIGKNWNQKFHKFEHIDTSAYDLDKENLFSNNRFAGIDYHDYGKRFNYGIDGAYYSSNFYLNSFLGQSIHHNNISTINNKEYVGNFSLNYDNDFECNYKFRKSKKLKSISDEIGMSYLHERFDLSSEYIILHKISNYFADNKLNITRNKIRNWHINGDLKINDNFSVVSGALFNILNNNKIKLLTRSIGVTYVKDCVSISAKVSNDFTQNSKRGVGKVESYSFTIGLKVLNF